MLLLLLRLYDICPLPRTPSPNLTLILTLTLNFNFSRNHNPKLLTPKTKGLFTAHELN